MENKKIKVSIIVTVFNIEKYIGECLDSILKQNMNDIEIICVDDSSKDNSLQILKNYEKNDSRIIVLHNEVNIGQASSRNKGCHLAQGEYLYVMDGDDCLQSGALNILYNCAKKNRLDFVTFSALVFGDVYSQEMQLRCKRAENLYLHNYNYQGVKTGIELLAKIMENGETPGNVCLQFINRKFFEKNNLYWIENLRYGEDSPFKMYMCAKRAMCIQDKLYKRRYRENSLVTSNKEWCHIESAIIQFVHDLQIWEETKNISIWNTWIERYFIDLQWNIELMYQELKDKKEELKLIRNYPMAKYIYNYFIVKQPLYCKSLTIGILEKIRKSRYIIVYGAGDIAKKACLILEENNVFNYKVAVTDKTREKKLSFPVEIYNIDELIQISEESIVVVATQRRHYKVITHILKAKGFTQIIYVDE